MTQRIVMFDGVCNLCHGAVSFIIQRDPGCKFQFVPLQSELAQQLFEQHQIRDGRLASFVLLEDDRYRLRTDAALAIASELTQPWPLFRVFYLVPAPLRDWFYDLLGRHRYRWFGRRDTCAVPMSDNSKRFLVDE